MLETSNQISSCVSHLYAKICLYKIREKVSSVSEENIPIQKMYLFLSH